MGLAFKQGQLFKLFSETSLLMSYILDLEQLFSFFVERMAEIFGAERVSVMLLDQEKQELYLKASRGFSLPAEEHRVKSGEMFAGWVVQRGEPLLVQDIEKEFPDLLTKDRLLRYKSKSFVIVPIKIKDEVVGLLSLTDRENNQVFTEDELRIIDAFCHCLAVHIENIRLLKRNADALTVDIATGLFNHRYFQEHILEEIYRAERYHLPLSLLMLDIDGFSCYNQAYGYSAGDNALKQIGRIIKENTRRIDAAARFGPEEFMVILPNTRPKQALVVAQKIKEVIDGALFVKNRASSLAMARLTVSIGVATHRKGVSREVLIQRAQSALAEAKQKGKNRICMFGSK